MLQQDLLKPYHVALLKPDRGSYCIAEVGAPPLDSAVAAHGKP